MSVGLKVTVNHWGEVTLDKTELRRLMRSAGNDVKSKTAALISRDSGGGRLYRGGGGGRYRGGYRPGHYRASAPGAPPVRVTGSLKSSLRTYVYPSGEGFAVRERQFYSLFLEAGAHGGKPGSRAAARRAARRRSAAGVRVLAPRPHLDTVMNAEEATLTSRVEKALTTGLTWRETK